MPATSATRPAQAYSLDIETNAELSFEAAQPLAPFVSPAKSTHPEQIAAQFVKRVQDIQEAERKRNSVPVLLSINLQTLEAASLQYLIDKAENPQRPYFVAVAGPSASGKTTQADQLFDYLGQDSSDDYIARISMDNFYKNWGPMRKEQGDEYFFNHTNLDEPAAFQLDVFEATLKELSNGKLVIGPEYDMTISTSFPERLTYHPKPVLLTEGLLVLTHHPENPGSLYPYDLSMFLDVEEDVLKKRWIERGLQQKRFDESTAHSFWQHVAREYQTNVRPTRDNATIVLNGAATKEDIQHVVREIADAAREDLGINLF